MTQEEIIRMAREAGYGLSLSDMHAPALERFAALVASAEREACTRICERHATVFLDGEELSDWKSGYGDGADACFDAIRARGEE